MTITERVGRLLFDYARAVDEHDLVALRELITDDVVITRIDGRHEGVEAFLDVYRNFAASEVDSSKHVVTNITVDAQDGGTYFARSYFEATMFVGDSTRRVFGQYADTVVEVDGVLKLAHKRITIERSVTLALS